MKVCSKCKIEKPFECFFKRGEDRSRYRSNCKACCKIINAKSTEAYRNNNKIELSKRAREKRMYLRKHNKEYSEKRKAYANKYYHEKLKPLCRNCKTAKPSNNCQYCDECRKKVHDEKYQAYIQASKDKINERQNIRVKKKVDNLTDGYIAEQIRGRKFPGWKLEEIPKEIIEMKRNVLKLKREIKNKTKQNDTTRTQL